MIKSICIISQRYPCKETPTVHVFVQKLVWALADLGVKMTVISPIAINEIQNRKTSNHYFEETSKGNKIEVYRPRYIYFGQKINFPIKMSHVSERNFYKACERVIKKNNIDVDAFYGHFICLAGICACRLGRKYGKPSFVAYGESTDWSIKNYGINHVKKELKSVSGVVAVSTNNKNVLTSLEILPASQIEVFVNGVNTNRFFPRDRHEARNKFNLKEEDFVVSFVGQFIERKGILKLNEAVNRLNGVKALYAGSGELTPTGDAIAFCGKLNPEEIPYLLSASDVFVFPSINEGCSNAVLEAMACGVPIIAHDAPFNYDILDTTNSILIDGTSVDEIMEAISNLMKNQYLLEVMREASLNKIKELSIDQRAERIHKWMSKVIKK